MDNDQNDDDDGGVGVDDAGGDGRRRRREHKGNEGARIAAVKATYISTCLRLCGSRLRWTGNHNTQ